MHNKTETFQYQSAGTISPSSDTAIVYRDIPISYWQLCVRTYNLAEQFSVQPGDRVVIFCENRPEWIYSLFAVWQAGGICVPVDALSKPEELTYIVQDSSPSLIIVSSSVKSIASKAIEKLPARPQIICLEDVAFETERENSARSNLLLHFGDTPQNTALVLYTSGTTGNPKGVMLSFGNIFCNVEGIRETGIVSSSDRVLSILPFHHSYPLMVTLLVPFLTGASVVMLERIAGEDIMRAMTMHKVTIFVCVPRVISLLHQKIMAKINASPLTLALFNLCKAVKRKQVGRAIFKKIHTLFGAQFRFFVSGGAKLDEQTAADVETLGFEILEGYGLTETSPIAAFNRPGLKRPCSVGQPIKGVEVGLKDGEVLIRGRNVMQGYLGLAQKTAETIRDGWLYTGDAGYIDDDGFLYITGRLKEMLVLASGKNINPEEIEAQLASQAEWVKEAAVTERNGRLFAFVHPDFNALEAAKVVNISETVKWKVIDAYNLTAREHAKITGFRVVQHDLPRTRLGKLRRFMLKSETIDRPASAPDNEPNDPVWLTLKTYLATLTTNPVYYDSHLEIDLGFDSLDKIELIVFLEKTFGVRITEEELSGFMELSRLVKHLRQVSGNAELKAGSCGLVKADVNGMPAGINEVLRQDVPSCISSSSVVLMTLKNIIRPVFNVFFHLNVQGVEYLTLPPMIICPNHQSYADGFLILASLPPHVLKNTYFVATEDFFRSDLRKFIAFHTHIIPLDPNKGIMDVMQKCASLLRQGKNIVIFPEGARTRDGSLMEFRETFAILASHTGASIAPVAINGAFEAYPVGQKLPMPGKVDVHFLTPLKTDGKSTKELAMLVRKNIEIHLQQVFR